VVGISKWRESNRRGDFSVLKVVTNIITWHGVLFNRQLHY
jgi:hypothetical protein